MFDLADHPSADAPLTETPQTSSPADTPAIEDIAAIEVGQKDIVASLAARVAGLATGDRANLRRMTIASPARTAGTVSGLLISAGLNDVGKMSDIAFRRWSIIAHCAALLSGKERNNAHAPGWENGLGRRLQAVGYSENRLMRLTSAKGAALEGQVVHAVRFIAQSGGGPIDLRTIRDLLNPEKAEFARLAIARSYYSANGFTAASVAT